MEMCQDEHHALHVLQHDALQAVEPVLLGQEDLTRTAPDPNRSWGQVAFVTLRSGPFWASLEISLGGGFPTAIYT